MYFTSTPRTCAPAAPVGSLSSGGRSPPAGLDILPAAAGGRAEEAARARALGGEAIGRGGQRAPVDRQAAAADAVGEGVAELLEPADPLLQGGPPVLGQPLPVLPARGAAAGQLLQRVPDVGERDAD